MWRNPTESSVEFDDCPFAPSLRVVAGSPHLVLSIHICLGDVPASDPGALGWKATGAAHERRPCMMAWDRLGLFVSKGVNTRNVKITLYAYILIVAWRGKEPFFVSFFLISKRTR